MENNNNIGIKLPKDYQEVHNLEAHELMKPYLDALSMKAVSDVGEVFNAIQLGPFKPYSLEGIVGGALVFLKSGNTHPQHRHNNSTANLLFIAGEGYVILGENEKKVAYERGSGIFVNEGEWHGFEVKEDSMFLTIQSGKSILEEDGKFDVEYRDPKNFSKYNGTL